MIKPPHRSRPYPPGAVPYRPKPLRRARAPQRIEVPLPELTAAQLELLHAIAADPRGHLELRDTTGAWSLRDAGLIELTLPPPSPFASRVPWRPMADPRPWRASLTPRGRRALEDLATGDRHG